MTAVEDHVEGDVLQVVYLPVDQLRPHPKNRDPGDVSDIAASIRRLGVLEPLLVRTAEPGFEIVAGGRRHAGAIEAGQMLVPCMIRDELDERQRVEARAVENLHRVDLHPLDEAAVYHELHELGATQAEIAGLVGVTQPFIAKRLGPYLRLDVDAQAAYRDGLLTVKQAEALAGLHDFPDVVASMVTAARDDKRRAHLDALIANELTAAKRRRVVAKVTADLAEQGIPTVSGYRGSMFLGESYGVMVDAAEHASEPCHAAHVSPDGTVSLLCTERARHAPSGASTLKASNVEDLAEPDATEHGDDDLPDEDDDEFRTQDEIAEAEAARANPVVDPRRVAMDESEANAAARIDAGRAWIGAQRSKSSVFDALVGQLLADEWVEAEDALATVLNLDAPEDNWQARVDAVRAFVTTGDEHPIQFMSAVAWLLGENQLRSVVRAWNPNTISAPARACAVEHLRRLLDAGYTPTAGELALLDAADEVLPEPDVAVDEVSEGGETDVAETLDEPSEVGAATSEDVVPDYSGTLERHRFIDGREALCQACGTSAGDAAHWSADDFAEPVTAEIDPARICRSSQGNYGGIAGSATGIACPLKCGALVSTDARGFVSAHLVREPYVDDIVPHPYVSSLDGTCRSCGMDMHGGEGHWDENGNLVSESVA